MLRMSINDSCNMHAYPVCLNISYNQHVCVLLIIALFNIAQCLDYVLTESLAHMYKSISAYSKPGLINFFF